MKERKEPDVPKILLYIIELIVILLLGVYLYFSSLKTESGGIYSEHAQKETIKSLMNALNLQNVHDVPLIGLTPRIQIYIKEDNYFVNTYYLEISRGNVIINDGISNQTDIIISTTEEEISKAVNNTGYMKESISSGRTTIKKTTSDFILFTEGYSNFEKFNAG
ncbi:Uncharacterised protein [uncultured archaeon]|nr:Uncharacterised protein [uncultured archaeon]